MEPARRIVRRWDSPAAEVVLMATDPGFVMRRERCPDAQYWLLLRGRWSDRRERHAREIVGGAPALYLPSRPAVREAQEATLSLGVRLYGTGGATLNWPARRALWGIAREFVTDESDPLRLDELSLGLLGRETARDPSPPAWLRGIRDRIEAEVEGNLDPPSTLRGLAREGGISPAHLSAAFARAYGVPLSTYRRQRRIERALRHVASDPIGHAAVEAGFYDASHFDRACRTELGMSPRQLRDLVRTAVP